jgi:speckle-type POZ protein
MGGVFVQVSVVADTVNITGQSSLTQFRVPECRLADDMGALFDSQMYSDCIVAAQAERQFPAHKAVLAARSPVFAAMFEAGMSESREHCVRFVLVRCTRGTRMLQNRGC